MNIIYVITVLNIYILFMLIYKTEKKQNLIAWLAISVILTLCYNVLICLMCTFIGTLCTLENLSICNIITAGILSTILIKGKRMQKYYVKIQEFIFSILLFILVVFIAYNQYGFPFNIKYYITDGSSHYFFAQQFYENSTLLYNKTTDDVLGMYNSKFRLPGAYINEGILFKVFDDIILKADIFILFDLFILYLSGILCFYLLKTYANNNKKSFILAILFSVIYMLGYQLNSMLYGYTYLSLALDIIIAFLLLITNYEKEEISITIALPILSLVSFGIFFSYAYFIPTIYIAVIINIILKSVKCKQKILSNKNIITLLYLIIIPTIVGVFYFILFPIVNENKTEISTIGTDGKIYENYITNYIAFIPILIISAILCIKNNRKINDYPVTVFILSIIFAIVLFIGNKFNIVSKYYFLKSYYIIWLLSICNVYILLSYIQKQENKKIRIITNIYISLYALTIILSLIFNKNIYINDIFANNQENIMKKGENILLEHGEVEFAEKAEKLIEDNKICLLVPNVQGRMFWISVLYHDQYIFINWKTEKQITIKTWLTEWKQKYYVAYYHDYDEIENEYPSEESNEYQIVYNNQYGFILERK